MLTMHWLACWTRPSPDLNELRMFPKRLCYYSDRAVIFRPTCREQRPKKAPNVNATGWSHAPQKEFHAVMWLRLVLTQTLTTWLQASHWCALSFGRRHFNAVCTFPSRSPIPPSLASCTKEQMLLLHLRPSPEQWCCYFCLDEVEKLKTSAGGEKAR